MKRAGLIPFEQVLEEQLQDPEFRAEWERTAPARDLAIRLIGYRVEHGMSLSALARRLGMSRSTVLRLEAGDEVPSPEMMVRLSETLGL